MRSPKWCIMRVYYMAPIGISGFKKLIRKKKDNSSWAMIDKKDCLLVTLSVVRTFLFVS